MVDFEIPTAALLSVTFPLLYQNTAFQGLLPPSSIGFVWRHTIAEK